MKWEKQSRRCWTAVATVAFDHGGRIRSLREVAFRIAPTGHPAPVGPYVVDIKSMGPLPWENASGPRTFKTKADAMRYAKRLRQQMTLQSSYQPTMPL